LRVDWINSLGTSRESLAVVSPAELAAEYLSEIQAQQFYKS